MLLAEIAMSLGMLLLGTEAFFAAREQSAWIVDDQRARRTRLLARATAVGVSALGACFVVWPVMGLHGGGLIGAAAVLVALRLLRPAADGADLMLVLLLAGTGVLGLTPSGWPRVVVEWCLLINICWSYWWSGAAKMRLASWRSGRAVALILNSRLYGRRQVAWYALEYSWVTRVAAWCTISIELFSPVFVLLGGQFLVYWAAAAFIMHFSIMIFMGLPRFFWSFTSALLVLLAIRSM